MCGSRIQHVITGTVINAVISLYRYGEVFRHIVLAKCRNSRNNFPRMLCDVLCALASRREQGAVSWKTDALLALYKKRDEPHRETHPGSGTTELYLIAP
jgi:hypothetical protein